MTRFNFTGEYVFVRRHTVNQESQTDTLIQLFAHMPGAHPATPPPPYVPSLGLYILVRNTSTSEVLYIDVAEGGLFDLSVDTSLRSARLDATLTTAKGRTMRIVLTWVAVGPPAINAFSHGRDQDEWLSYVSHVDFKERRALVSGWISDPGLGFNFSEVSDALVGITRQGSVQMLFPR